MFNSNATLTTQPKIGSIENKREQFESTILSNFISKYKKHNEFLSKKNKKTLII